MGEGGLWISSPEYQECLILTFQEDGVYPLLIIEPELHKAPYLLTCLGAEPGCSHRTGLWNISFSGRAGSKRPTTQTRSQVAPVICDMYSWQALAHGVSDEFTCMGTCAWHFFASEVQVKWESASELRPTPWESWGWEVSLLLQGT